MGNCQVLGETIHITLEYLVNEEKAIVANSKVEALKAKGSCLRKDLITAMDDSNASKERLLVLQKDQQLVAANQKVKSITAKAVQVF